MKKINFKFKGVKMPERAKKATVLTLMIALLVTVGVLNVNLTKEKTDNTPVSNDTSVSVFFESHRASRAQARQEEISILDSIIGSTEVSAEVKQEANAKKLALCDKIETEYKLENLIKAKGFKEAAVIVSPSVLSIMVASDNAHLTDTEFARIYTVVVNNTSFDLDNVCVTTY